MSDTAPRNTRRHSLRIALTATALPTALAAGCGILSPVTAGAQDLSSQLFGSTAAPDAPGEPPVRTPVETTYPDVGGLPAGVSVDRVEWISSRHIKVFIKSAAMPDQLMQVQILLARDWHSNPTRTFPEVWALDGLRARDDENGWTIETNIAQQFADRNVNVILPVGGQSSFYSDWEQPNNGKNYKWETFLMKELIPVLDNGFRSNRNRSVVGISMGGTAAVNLAERNPGIFKFVGSFSGYLDTTSPGMPEAIKVAQQDAGGFNSDAMWGPAYSQDWIDHDPKLGIEALKGSTVYVSAGSGRDDFGQPGSAASRPGSAAGMSLEVLSRMTSQTFVNAAKKTPVNVITQFRPSGVHSWDYWQYEIGQAWPYMADAMALSREDRGSDCIVQGDIAKLDLSIVGSCVTNEYAMDRGVAQDFRNGTAYWSPQTGAYALYGTINGLYSSMGAATSWLGFPVTTELGTPDGVGRFVHFEHGSIYWTRELGAFAVAEDIMKAWGAENYERGEFGYPNGNAFDLNGNTVFPFQGGWFVRTKNHGVHWVRGDIGKRWVANDPAVQSLGQPTGNERLIPGGAFQEFEHGNIYWTHELGPKVIRYGQIFDTWGKHRWEQGEYGWPTEDMKDIPAGGLEMKFQHGIIREINGQIQEERH
ncbi:hypothetical protein GSS88_02370 [Corynebacterium sp. 3HC-13]|uniref:alpha/beta hydrolase-fold protein n=1 Tax=Corynebacterium poyangense TaxID=2684405 RepID=UPI001CCFD3E9|nr:alpha/beta hydrolase-fold protein [Corynebacterium poyangense]MBZ8176643.1 hypothetical protein [Corynebacterium poyangense]